jgi:hypothetical protein
MANHQSTVVLLPHEFVAMCEADGVSPDEVLNGFLADLCGLHGSHGSDERDLAQHTMIAAAPIGDLDHCLAVTLASVDCIDDGDRSLSVLFCVGIIGL